MLAPVVGATDVGAENKCKHMNRGSQDAVIEQKIMTTQVHIFFTCSGSPWRGRGRH